MSMVDWLCRVSVSRDWVNWEWGMGKENWVELGTKWIGLVNELKQEREKEGVE